MTSMDWMRRQIGTMSVQSAQDASKTRQRIEMLREERLLQQALIDTFDL